MRSDPPKVRCKLEMEMDKISNLPGEIIHNILSQLPLRDAARTSILSSKWRYKWATLPSLVVDNQSFPVSSRAANAVKNRLVNIVDQIIVLHSGPIEKFKFCPRNVEAVNDIDRWILFLSRGSVKEFVLEIWKGHRYKLPSSLYVCQNLVHLELYNCVLKPPPGFSGFKKLKNLDLQRITLDQNALDHMISSCPLLERLTIINCDGVAKLKIHAPNLLFFDVGGIFESVDFEETHHLALVSFGLYANAGYDYYLTFGSAGNLSKFFAHLPSIQRLEVQSYLLKYLAAGKVPGRLPTPCMKLCFLALDINFSDIDENLAALCLLKSSPNLQQLKMIARQQKQSDAAASKDRVENNSDNCMFHELRTVNFTGISGLMQELYFIKLLLANSPVLKKMTIKPAAKAGGWEPHKLMKELLCFRRASMQAQIVYLDP